MNERQARAHAPGLAKRVAVEWRASWLMSVLTVERREGRGLGLVRIGPLVSPKPAVRDLVGVMRRRRLAPSFTGEANFYTLISIAFEALHESPFGVCQNAVLSS